MDTGGALIIASPQSGPPPKAAPALLLPTGQPGLYLKTEAFQAAIARLHEGFSELWDEPKVLAVHSPGLMSRGNLERSSYLQKFPQFVCTVVPQLAGEDGEGAMVTIPSACLCIYPLVEGLGVVPEGGFLVTVQAPCVRNETRYAPERMRAFTMSEYVFFGRPEQTEVFRQTMTDRVSRWLTGMGLQWRLEAANDPFYGRLGEMLIERQRAEGLKLEILLPIAEGSETACFSFNDHREFFALRWNIQTAWGGLAHSSCVGVGLERLVLAMIHRHGADPGAWPPMRP